MNYHQWNSICVGMMQAMLGAITPNFRMIVLEYIEQESKLIVCIYLDKNIEEDIQEAQDIYDSFSMNIEDMTFLKLNLNMYITTEPLTIETNLNIKRYIYKRNEETYEEH